jgi:predicted transcriptional regulator
MRKSKVAKLTAAQVQSVLTLFIKEKWSQSRIAQKMGISQTAVSMILRGVTYKWATGFKAA